MRIRWEGLVGSRGDSATSGKPFDSAMDVDSVVCRLRSEEADDMDVAWEDVESDVVDAADLPEAPSNDIVTLDSSLSGMERKAISSAEPERMFCRSCKASSRGLA